jgi:hypothetical protein
LSIFQLNAQTTGFFRVEYSEEMLVPLLAAFRPQPAETSLSVLDRYGLASDMLAVIEFCFFSSNFLIIN